MAQKFGRGSQLFCLLIIAIGLIGVGMGGWLLIKSIRSEHWPVTEGIVQSAEVKSHRNRSKETYSAEVAYSYQVVGETYTGRKVAIGQMAASLDYARGIANRYPVGKKVSVHYSPSDPSDAVLETGIHGSMWICFGVGTLFTLAGIMFLHTSRAAAKAQSAAEPQSSSVTVQADGSVRMDKPPVLMGVIFLLVGISLCFVPPDSGKPFWLMYAVGGVFASGGVTLLLMRLENKVYQKIAMMPALVAFLAVFHWVSFGVGERNGSVSTPFSTTDGVNARMPFAVFTILLDLVIVACFVRWVFKRATAVTKPTYGSGQPATKSSLEFCGAGLVLLVAISAIFFVLHRRPATTPTETPFVSTPIDDAFWLNLDRHRSDIYRKQLKAAPQVLVVRETHYSFNPTNGMGAHYGLMDGKMANLHVGFSELVAYAYGHDYSRTEFPKAWTRGQWTNFYDVIVTVTNQPKEALQSAAKQFLRQEYGLSWHLKARKTDVLVLRAKDLKLLQSKATQVFAQSKSIPEFTRELENYFSRPVIDETGATNRYDKIIGEVPSRWVDARSTDLGFNNQFMATVGLELVATKRTQEWLVLD